ncbi:MAG: glycosyltransferase family A protein [Anderseniella sp.]|jgi:glycosyltransferase involved in cell wall biosynthesis|nr:glycosyltransferase family A protein [Anderseniella sp.]
MNSPAPKISVIIPCYNAGGTIARTIASVQDQSEPGWEIVAVDDGSSDDTLDKLIELAGQDPRIRIVRQLNAGVSAARNTGIQKSAAPVVAFLDADDIWYRNYLSRVLAKLAAQPELGFTFTRVDILDEHASPTGRSSSFETGEIGLDSLLRGNPATTCSNLAVRREVFDDTGYFETRLNHAEDQLWMVMAALHGWKIEGINEVLMGYRTNPRGLSSNLEAMRAGWEVMAHLAWFHSPERVGHVIKGARADNLLYLARRAVRLKAGFGPAFRYLAHALLIDPALVTRRLAAVPLRIRPRLAATANLKG